jgi:hypothetical protein
MQSMGTSENRVAGMASSYWSPPRFLVRAGHAREKPKSDPNAVTLTAPHEP